MIVARESSIGDSENAVSTQFDSSISSRICPQFFNLLLMNGSSQ